MTAIPLYVLYILTGSPIAIFMIFVNLSLILLVLNPVLKFDGYWLLADALGVINLREKSLALMSHYYRRFTLREPGETPNRFRFPRKIKLLVLIYGACSSIVLGVWILSLILYAPTMVSGYVLTLVTSGRIVGQMMLKLQLAESAAIILNLTLQALPTIAVLLLLYRLSKMLIQFVPVRFSRKNRSC